MTRTSSRRCTAPPTTADQWSDRKVRGGVSYLRACGRREHRFHPFEWGVQTTLRVRRAVDAVYDVKHAASSRERRTQGPRMAARADAVAAARGGGSATKGAPARAARERDAYPTPVSYDPLASLHSMDRRGRLGIAIGGRASRMSVWQAPPTAAQPPAGDDVPDASEAAADAEAAAVAVAAAAGPPTAAAERRQMCRVPERHVPCINLALAAGRDQPPRPTSASPSCGGTREQDEEAAAAASSEARRGRWRRSGSSAASTAPQQHPASTAAATGAGGSRVGSPSASNAGEGGGGGGGGVASSGRFSTTRFHRLQRYNWLCNTFPTASDGVPYQPSVAYPRDKNVARVSMRRQSGRSRSNQTRENCEALDKILKRINSEQETSDKKICCACDDAGASMFGVRPGRGPVWWLDGGRLDRAMQGTTEAAVSQQPSRIAEWARVESESISRRVEAQARSAGVRTPRPASAAAVRPSPTQQPSPQPQAPRRPSSAPASRGPPPPHPASGVVPGGTGGDGSSGGGGGGAGSYAVSLRVGQQAAAAEAAAQEEYDNAMRAAGVEAPASTSGSSSPIP